MKEAGFFSDGLAWAITKNGKLGYIDESGKFVIKPAFSCSHISSSGAMIDDTRTAQFNDGLAAVFISGSNPPQCLYLTKTGKNAFARSWLDCHPFSQNLAAVCELVEQTPAWGIIDKNGHYLVQPKFDYIGQYSEGLCTFQQGYRYGFLGTHGQIVIKPTYYDAGQFSEGLAPAAVFKGMSNDGNRKKLWGYIDKQGKWIIEPQYEYVSCFSHGKAEVGNGGGDSDPSYFRQQISKPFGF